MNIMKSYMPCELMQIWLFMQISIQS